MSFLVILLLIFDFLFFIIPSMNIYESLNKKDISTRVKESAVIEQWIIDTMNHHGVSYNGVILKNWKKTNTSQDKKYKRDAESFDNDLVYYAQVKFRQADSGSDIGAVLYQPYFGLSHLKEQQISNKEVYDKLVGRDYKFDGQIYAVLNNNWSKLYILPYLDAVKPMLDSILQEWFDSNISLNTNDRSFRSKVVEGAELKWTVDKGRGYGAGEEKIMCYIPFNVFKDKKDVICLDMISLS